jgi:hypothetical protein
MWLVRAGGAAGCGEGTTNTRVKNLESAFIVFFFFLKLNWFSSVLLVLGLLNRNRTEPNRKFKKIFSSVFS